MPAEQGCKGEQGKEGKGGKGAHEMWMLRLDVFLLRGTEIISDAAWGASPVAALLLAGTATAADDPAPGAPCRRHSMQEKPNQTRKLQ